MRGWRTVVWLLALLVVCTSAPSIAAAKVELTFGVPYGVDAFDSVFLLLAEEFEKRNPDVKVTVETGWEKEKIITAAAGQVGPDLGIVVDVDANPMSVAGLYVPLDGMLRRSGVRLDTFLAGRVWTAGGQVYGLPMFIDPNFPLVYSQRMLAEAGLDAKQPPATIAELDVMYPRLTRRGADGRVERLAMAMWNSGPGHIFQTWGLTFGAQYWEGDETRGRFNLLSSAWISAMTWFQGYHQRYYADAWPDKYATKSSATRMSNGQQVMAYLITSEYKFLKEEAPDYDWSVAAPMTTPQGAPAPIWFGGLRFGVSRYSKNPEAAFELLRFIATDSKASTIIGQCGLFGAYRNAPAFRVLVERDPVWLPFINALALSPGEYYKPVLTQWQGAATEFRKQLLDQGAAPRAALENMQRVLNGAARDAGIIVTP